MSCPESGGTLLHRHGGEHIHSQAEALIFCHSLSCLSANELQPIVSWGLPLSKGRLKCRVTSVSERNFISLTRHVTKGTNLCHQQDNNI